MKIRKFLGHLLLLIILHGLVAFPIWAAGGTTGASFLDIPVGAGPAALGSAYTALAMDAYAPVWNPAGLGRVDSFQLAGQHLAYLESIHYEFLGLTFPLKEGRTLGFAAQYLGSGDIAGFSDSGATQGSYSTHYGAYSLAYGQVLGEKLSLGVTGKVLEAAISDVSAHAFAADVGSLYKVNDRLSLAAVAANLGNKLTFLNDDSSLPWVFRLGGSYQPLHSVTTALEVVFSKEGTTSGHLGVEWKPLDLIAVRAGYRTDNTKEVGGVSGLTAGLGLSIWGQEFQYAWVPYGDLGNSHYFSILMRFGGKDAKRNMVQIESIKRHPTASTERQDNEGQQLMELLKVDTDKTAAKPVPPTKGQNP